MIYMSLNSAIFQCFKVVDSFLEKQGVKNLSILLKIVFTLGFRIWRLNFSKLGSFRT